MPSEVRSFVSSPVYRCQAVTACLEAWGLGCLVFGAWGCGAWGLQGLGDLWSRVPAPKGLSFGWLTVQGLRLRILWFRKLGGVGV